MLQSLRSMLIFIAIASSVNAKADLEEEFLEYITSGELQPHGQLEIYSQKFKVSLPHMRKIFNGATLAFLNTWEANPFSAFPINLRLKLAVFAVRAENGSLFNQTQDPVLWWMLLNLAVAKRHLHGRSARDFCIDVVACGVLQNIFPMMFRDDPETTRYRAFSKRTLARHREQIYDVINVALRSHPLHLDRVEHRAQLVKYLSQITSMRFGWSALRYKMDSFIEEHLPSNSLRIPALIEFARRSLSSDAIIAAMIVMYSPRQD